MRYVGEPVAVVFAENAYLAEDAADLVELDIEQTRATLLATEEPGLFEHNRSTEASVLQKTYGDVDKAFAGAHAVVSLELSIGRHSGVPLETRGAIARYDEARDVLEMHGAAKVPHWNRDTLAQMLGRKRDAVQLYEGHVGGGFGIRGEIYPEDVLVCAAALKFRRPVKWIEDRREHLIAANHSRQQHHKIRAAIDGEGHILGIEDEFFHDNGAYMRTHAATVPDLTAAMLPGPYRVPAYRAIGHIRLTNKTPCGTYRAPGRYESSFVRERLLDAIAAKVGVDRVDIRRRNLIAKSAMPYALGLDTLGTHIVYDSGDYALLLDKALKSAGWDAMQTEMKKRRATGEKVGCGLAMFVEKSGLGPFDSVRIDIAADGGIEVVTGVASLGQGVETVDGANLRRRARRRLRAYQSHPRPDRAHRQRHGRICLARDGDVRGSNAARRRETARPGFAGRRRIDASDRGQTRHRQWRDRDQRRRSVDAARRTGAQRRRLERRGYFRIPPHGLSLWRAHRRRAHRCRHRRRRRSSAMRSPTTSAEAVNPKLVEGQIAGGLAQGVGGALLEEFVYSDTGEPLSVTFADYLMPTAREIPALSVLITEDAPSPLNPLGLKGAGEGGANPVGAAIASAIDDALQRPGAVTQLPVTPQRLKISYGLKCGL